MNLFKNINMGGKALRQLGIESERVDTQTFNQYYSEISKVLFDKLGIESYQTRCYHTKETHGDLDILLKIDHTFYNKGINLKKWVTEIFKPLGLFDNGAVISWEYKNFQIDFIPIKESNWEMAKMFFDYSPVGNLIGKVAHKFGLKYGWDGLVFPVRNFNGRLNEKIEISKNPSKIFDFLGFDYNRYQLGFDTEQEIFDYVVNSKYFCSDSFKMENLRHIDRKRNQKRPDYNRFLSYINDNNIFINYDFKSKTEYIDIINDTFLESKLKTKLNILKQKDDTNKILNSKFNGKIIMEHFPSIRDKQLGHLMTDFKNKFTNYKESFIEMSTEEIMDEFNNYLCNNLKL